MEALLKVVVLNGSTGIEVKDEVVEYEVWEYSLKYGKYGGCNWLLTN